MRVVHSRLIGLKYLIIVLIVLSCGVGIGYLLNTDYNVKEYPHDITVISKSKIWPPHEGGDYSLLYKNKVICKRISAGSPNSYLLSPDQKYLLYVNDERPTKELVQRYELYKIKDDEKILFPYSDHLIGLNERVIWQEDVVILEDGLNRDVLHVKTSQMTRQ